MVKLYKNFNIKNNHKNSLILIGNFDGVHLGHQKLFKLAKLYKKKYMLSKTINIVRRQAMAGAVAGRALCRALPSGSALQIRRCLWADPALERWRYQRRPSAVAARTGRWIARGMCPRQRQTWHCPKQTLQQRDSCSRSSERDRS